MIQGVPFSCRAGAWEGKGRHKSLPNPGVLEGSRNEVAVIQALHAMRPEASADYNRDLSLGKVCPNLGPNWALIGVRAPIGAPIGPQLGPQLGPNWAPIGAQLGSHLGPSWDPIEAGNCASNWASIDAK